MFLTIIVSRYLSAFATLFLLFIFFFSWKLIRLKYKLKKDINVEAESKFKVRAIKIKKKIIIGLIISICLFVIFTIATYLMVYA
ncbi:hypothetical protein [Spiroplasma taiwanense]|uniref:Transmembrane protein n=1 Tax=Spiroplasma taiwanense CT-1 TaxID=1276220 RepID=S5LZG7_9MOLU|nr:hypothetical protein [Spiroplasma taiwanense]AGR41102.1 hypothetical protein STAIW_v1c04560 [Spiroplasma taiwanense CT-1]